VKIELTRAEVKKFRKLKEGPFKYIDPRKYYEGLEVKIAPYPTENLRGDYLGVYFESDGKHGGHTKFGKVIDCLNREHRKEVLKRFL
jgi:hypothetical protein